MLTGRGVLLAVTAVVAWALGRFLGVDELYVVSGAAVAMLALAIISTRVSSARIAVRRASSTRHAHRGERVPIEVALRNDGRLPASLLLVEDHRPSGMSGADTARFVVRGLRPHRVVQLVWHAVGRRRGRYRIGPLRIRLRDPFGLAERSRRYRGTDDVIVFPAVEPLRSDTAIGTRHGSDTSTSQRAFHHGEEFHTMRQYIVGDDLRHVHWPSTAHHGTLMVRQHELPWQARAVVYIDDRASVHTGVSDRSTFERSVSAAASVLSHLAAQRYDLGLVTGTRWAVDEPIGLDEALVHLAELRSTPDRSPVPTLHALERAGSGMVIAIVRPPARPAAGAAAHEDLADHVELRALQRAGRGYRTRVALVVQHDDDERSRITAKLLRLAGWHAAEAAPGAPLADAWRRATIGGEVGRSVARS